MDEKGKGGEGSFLCAAGLLLNQPKEAGTVKSKSRAKI
jgi:hypothetical protein